VTPRARTSAMDPSDTGWLAKGTIFCAMLMARKSSTETAELKLKIKNKIKLQAIKLNIPLHLPRAM